MLEGDSTNLTLNKYDACRENGRLLVEDDDDDDDKKMKEVPPTYRIVET
jgi:hypothetical protein